MTFDGGPSITLLELSAYVISYVFYTIYRIDSQTVISGFNTDKSVMAIRKPANKYIQSTHRIDSTTNVSIRSLSATSTTATTTTKSSHLISFQVFGSFTFSRTCKLWVQCNFASTSPSACPSWLFSSLCDCRNYGLHENPCGS